MLERSATHLAQALRCKEISSRELVAACLEQIEALDGRLQAFITVAGEKALAEGEELDRLQAQGQFAGPLHGLPVAIKDNIRTKGIRTTWGSPLRRDVVPPEDDEAVRRVRAAGGIVIGKTNTPEFAFGAVCTNPLKGPTANPWNEALTSGGSSGGSAVAVTTFMTPLALGTDFGGSVRTPASFCGCVGLRPTPVCADGSVPLSTVGALTRTVDDAALVLQVLNGNGGGPSASSGCLKQASRGALLRPRVAASATLNGVFRIDAPVRAAFEAALDTIADVFGPLARSGPDMSGASEAFRTLRAGLSWRNHGALVESHADELSPSFVWNVRLGRNLSAEDLVAAEDARAKARAQALCFFQDYDILVLPSASVLPFPNEQGEITEIDGTACETIIDYLACTYLVSLIGFPAISLPALWTQDGRPFGIQLVARPFEEATLLQAAHRLEANGFQHRTPPRCHRSINASQTGNNP